MGTPNALGFCFDIHVDIDPDVGHRHTFMVRTTNLPAGHKHRIGRLTGLGKRKGREKQGPGKPAVQITRGDDAFRPPANESPHPLKPRGIVGNFGDHRFRPGYGDGPLFHVEVRVTVLVNGLQHGQRIQIRYPPGDAGNARIGLPLRAFTAIS